MTAIQQLPQLIDQLQQYLRWQRDHGCRGVDCTDATRRILAAWHRPDGDRRIRTPPPRETLAVIREDLGDCRRCRLHRRRNRIVFGAGNPEARLMFVGEAPGYHEDRQGEPFVGPAGQLLNKIIAAMQLTRAEVYIANVIKCHPPDNRNPLPEEIASCAPFLNRQVQSVQPEIICALGTYAAQTLLKTDHPISRLRGRFHDYHGIRLLPTFHPSYLLHHPEKKRPVWEDMQQVMAALGMGS